jgi:hypothetical protein
MREHRVWCITCNLVVHGRHRPTYGTKTFHGHIRFHNIHTRLRPDDLTMFAVSRTNQFTEMMFASEESWHVLTRASPMWRARAWTTTRFPLYAVAPVKSRKGRQLLLHLHHPTPACLPNCTPPIATALSYLQWLLLFLERGLAAPPTQMYQVGAQSSLLEAHVSNAL